MNNFKFANSDIVVRYMLASEQIRSGLAVKILDRIFTTKNHDGIYYQDMFNNEYPREEAVAKLESWLLLENINEDGIAEIRKIVDYPETSTKMSENRKVVEEQLNAKGIPTMVYDGTRHTGLWKE